MRITEWGYQNEQEFVKAAMVNPVERKRFEQFNAVLVERFVLKYIRTLRLNRELYRNLVNAGLKVFDPAFNKYIKLPNAYDRSSYRFSTYYMFWVKTAIEQYLDKKGQ